jgi:hypothetical protein
VPHTPIAHDATIADILGTLAKPEDYVRGVLENLYSCLSERPGSQKRDLVVRIGVTGRGIVPHYQIEYFDEVDLSVGRRTVPVTFGGFDGRTHKKIAVLEEASIQREESILIDENWSTRTTTFKEVENILGQIRDLKQRADRAISLFDRRNLYAQARDVADEINYPATIRGGNPVKAGDFGAAARGSAVASRRARSVRISGWHPPRAPPAQKRPSQLM